jgi:CBS domain-containing protein
MSIEHLIRRDVPLLAASEPLSTALVTLLESGLPALPAVDDGARLAGIFGEREFIEALFPGYLGQLRHTAFLRHSLDDVLERRGGCRDEPVGNHLHPERVQVGVQGSETQIAELFLHHRVLIVPVVDAGRVSGVVTRSDFFRAAARRLLAQD